MRYNCGSPVVTGFSCELCSFCRLAWRATLSACARLVIMSLRLASVARARVRARAITASLQAYGVEVLFDLGLFGIIQDLHGERATISASMLD